jgi:hypothetical protein
MSENEKNNDEGEIYRVDTVPPPPGEGDAYNAPTRVGAMAESVLIEEMIHAAESEAASGNDTGAFAKPSTALIGKPPSQLIQTPLASPSPLIPKAPPVPSVPKKPLPLPPRPAAGRVVSAPPPPIRTHAANGSGAPTELNAEDMISAPPEAMPSFCNDPDDADDEDEYAPTLLHKNAQPLPPPEPLLDTQQAFVPMPMPAPAPAPAAPAAPPAPVPSVAPAPAPNMAAVSRPPRAPIPYDPIQEAARTEQATARVSLVPLFVGFGIFVVGLLLYLFVR